MTLSVSSLASIFILSVDYDIVRLEEPNQPPPKVVQRAHLFFARDALRVALSRLPANVSYVSLQITPGSI
jgi:hypothetical protein